MDRETNVKDRLVKAALELLTQNDIEAITSRDIANHANVSLGNINYYFKSKEELLSFAVQEHFSQTVQIFKNSDKQIRNPKKELTLIIHDFFEHLAKYKAIGRYVLKYKLTTRTFNSERYLLPYIAKYYENTNIEPISLKLKALQLSSVITMAFFNSKEFYRYADIDLNKSSDVNKMIEALIDNVLC
jgi:AcrR family transcriptional regulator